MIEPMASQAQYLAAADFQVNIKNKFGSEAVAVWRSLGYYPQLSKTKSQNDVHAVEGWRPGINSVSQNHTSSVTIRDYAFDFQAARIRTVDFPDTITLENCSLVAGQATFHRGSLKATNNGVTVTALGQNAIAVASAEGASAKALYGNRSTLIATCAGAKIFCGFAEEVNLYIAAKAVELYVGNDNCSVHFPAVAPDEFVSVGTNVDSKDWQNWLQQLEWETVSVKDLKEAMDASGEGDSNTVNKWTQLVSTWEVTVNRSKKMDSANAQKDKWRQIIAMFKKV